MSATAAGMVVGGGWSVSVVVPMRNAARRLTSTLDSLRSQTVAPTDVLLVDDASTDETSEIAARYIREHALANWQVLAGPGRGAGAARNLGVRASKGAYVAFLDDDDLWVPTKLERCRQAMAHGAEVACHSEWWEDARGRRELRDYSELMNRDIDAAVSFFRVNPLSTSATVLARALFDRTGGFDEAIESAEDFDLWMRCALETTAERIVFVREPLGVYTLRANSESAGVARRYRAMRLIGKRYGPIVARRSRWGAIERIAYAARVRITSGVRFLRGGDVLRGIWLCVSGLLLWPFRLDLLRAFLRQGRAQSSAPAGVI